MLKTLSPASELISSSFEGQRFIAHCQDVSLPHLFDVCKPGDVQLLIGPEGDFSSEEIEQAKEMGFIEVSLGKSRLRTETAGVTSCNTIHLANREK